MVVLFGQVDYCGFNGHCVSVIKSGQCETASGSVFILHPSSLILYFLSLLAPHLSLLFSSSLYNLYSKLSTRAIQLASMMFSLTPTVPQTSSSSWLSMITRTPAAVAASEFITRTL